LKSEDLSVILIVEPRRWSASAPTIFFRFKIVDAADFSPLDRVHWFLHSTTLMWQAAVYLALARLYQLFLSQSLAPHHLMIGKLTIVSLGMIGKLNRSSNDFEIFN
jgi:hypothetical protein